MEFDNYGKLLQKAPTAVQKDIGGRYRLTNIGVLGDCAPFMRHVFSGKFMGRCYESASLSALMLDDDAVVQHGEIDLPEAYDGERRYLASKGYKHAWVAVRHNGKKYIFDPALSMLADADEYSEKFNAEISREIPAEKIKRFIVDTHLGRCLKEYGNRQENYGYICGIKTNEESIAEQGKYDSLPHPYFNISAGAQTGLIIGDINIHIALSANEQIKGFDAKLYMNA